VGNHSPLPHLNKIDPAPVDGFGLRTCRHRDQQLLPPSSMPIGPFATLPASSPKMLAPPQRTQVPP
jgi:hypothetical protein